MDDWDGKWMNELANVDIWEYRAKMLTLIIKGQKRPIKVNLIAEHLRKAYLAGVAEARELINRGLEDSP